MLQVARPDFFRTALPTVLAGKRPQDCFKTPQGQQRLALCVQFGLDVAYGGHYLCKFVHVHSAAEICKRWQS
jgi:hypothetical protein